MSDYTKGYNAVMKLANIQMYMDPSPFSYGVQSKEQGSNYLPLAMVDGVAPAAAAGVSLGSAGSLLTGKSLGGHVSTALRESPGKAMSDAKDYMREVSGANRLSKRTPAEHWDRFKNRGLGKTLESVKNHVMQTPAKHIGRSALLGGIGGAAVAGGAKALYNTGAYGTGHVLAPPTGFGNPDKQ